MQTFNIGDRVKIKDNLLHGYKYGNDIYTDAMRKGCQATITEFDPTTGNFRLSGCSFSQYTPEMLENITLEAKVQEALGTTTGGGQPIEHSCSQEQGEVEGEKPEEKDAKGNEDENKESEQDGEGEPKESDKEQKEENKDNESEEKPKKKQSKKEEKTEEQKQEEQQKKEEEKQQQKQQEIVNNKHEMNIIEKAVAANIPTLLVGETGTGKTTIVRAVAKKHNMPLVRINLNGQTGREELIGKYILLGGETIWQDGPLVVGLKQGAWILLDEINAALPEVLFVIQALAESTSGKLGDILLAEKDGEIVHPHPDCRLFGTANPADKYVGTKEFNPATLSRFLMLEIKVLPQAEEKKLLANKFPNMNPGIIHKLSDIGLKMRQKYANEEIAYFCSTRDLVYMAELINKGLDDTDAFEVVIMNKIQTRMEKEVVARDLKTLLNRSLADVEKFVSEFEEVKKIIVETQLTLIENVKLKADIEAKDKQLLKLKEDFSNMESKQKNIEELRKLLA